MPNHIVPDNSRDETSHQPKQLAAPAVAEEPAEETATTNWKPRAAVVCALVVFLLAWFGYSQRRDIRPPAAILNVANVNVANGISPTQNGANTKPQLDRSVSGNIKVHVAGRVRNPGVYVLPPNARVEDAVKRAGGALKDGDVNAINLAQWAEDGSRIDVPRKETLAPIVQNAPNQMPRTADVSPRVSPRYIPRALSAAPKSAPSTAKGVRSKSTALADEKSPIDINRADAQTLDALPGVGPVTAQKILDYRRENGAFKTVDDLEEVKGIGPAKLEKMRPFVVVR